MAYMKQFCVILLVSFLGEALRAVLPFSVPGSIYGMILLFAALCLGVLKLEQVRDVSLFLLEIMPLLFVSAGVGLMESWDVLRPILFPVLVILLVTTVVVMVVSGRSTQAILFYRKWFVSGKRDRQKGK